MDNTNFMKDFYSSWMDFNTNMMKSTMELSAESWKPENYEKYYNNWSKNMSEMIEKLMRMPGFAKCSWEAFKTTSGFQKTLNEMTEGYLKNLNVPGQKDIDELSQRINYLDDRLEEMEKKLNELSKK